MNDMQELLEHKELIIKSQRREIKFIENILDEMQKEADINAYVIRTLKPLIDRIADFERDNGSLCTLDLEHAQEVGLMVRSWTGTNSMREMSEAIA